MAVPGQPPFGGLPPSQWQLPPFGWHPPPPGGQPQHVPLQQPPRARDELWRLTQSEILTYQREFQAFLQRNPSHEELRRLALNKAKASLNVLMKCEHCGCYPRCPRAKEAAKELWFMTEDYNNLPPNVATTIALQPMLAEWLQRLAIVIELFERTQ